MNSHRPCTHTRWPEGRGSENDDEVWSASEELRSEDGYDIVGQDGRSAHRGDTTGKSGAVAQSRAAADVPSEGGNVDRGSGHGLLGDTMSSAAGAASLLLLGGSHPEEVSFRCADTAQRNNLDERHWVRSNDVALRLLL